MSQAFRCDGVHTPQAYIWYERNSQKKWAVEIKGLGLNSPFWVPGDPKGARYQVKVCGDPKFNPIRPFEGSWDQIWTTGALRGPRRPPKGPFRVKTSPAPCGPEEARYQVKVCVDHESNSGGPMGGSWDQIWPTRALGAPQRAFGGPKRALLGPLGPRRCPIPGQSVC